MISVAEKDGSILPEFRALQKEYHELRYHLPEALLEINIISPRLLFMNQMALILFGYTQADFEKGVELHQLVEPEQCQHLQKVVDKYVSDNLHRKLPYTRVENQALLDLEMIRKDGSKFRAETQTSVMLDESGQPFGIRAMIREAKAGKNVEHGLLHSEERYKLAIDAGRIGIWEWHITSGKLYFSHGMQELLGYTDREFDENLDSWLDQIHPEDRARVARKLQDCIEGHAEKFEVEHRLIHKDGGRRWFLMRGSVKCDASGELQSIVGSNTEITDTKLAEQEKSKAREAIRRARIIEQANMELKKEIDQRKKVEEALRKSEERYRLLYQDNPAMYFTLDARGTVKLANKFGAEKLGYTVKELVGQSVAKVFVPGDRETVLQQLNICVENPGRTFQWELQKLRKDGSVLWVRESARAISDSAGNCNLLVVCHDISEEKRAETERIELEDKVRYAQKMESVGHLAGGIAHDFNNLLTGILGNASLAIMDLPKTSQAYESIKLIEESALQAANLTSQLLAYAGKGRYLVGAIDLSALIDDMKQMVCTLTNQNKNAIISYDLRPGLPKLMADAAQIKQIVMNLVTNAVEALGNNPGEVQVNTGYTVVDEGFLKGCYLHEELTPGTYVHIEVVDTGSGMDKATRSKIFDPFFTTKTVGRGLGLAALLGIVRGHNGTVKVESKEGQGTRLRVLFPAIPKTKAAGSETAPKPLPRDKDTVLVVEDESIARKAAKRILEKFGYSVLLASDGLEGVSVFRENASSIKVVLLDMTMPKMDGNKTLEAMQRIKPDVKVILASGYSEREAFSRLPKAKLSAFLQKPYKPQALVSKVRNVLERNS